MFDLLDFSLERLIYVVPAIIIALTLHELAHGLTAYAYGDPTAKNAGRLTLNPLRHMDAVGTLLLIVAGFGWAKPVPVNPYYFGAKRNQKMMVVSLAGPLTNLVQALLGGLLLKALIAVAVSSAGFAQSGVTNYLFNLLQYFISINVVLAVFNLFPIPPLDGSRILGGLLGNNAIRIMEPLERYGFAVLMLLAIFGLLGKLLTGPVQAVVHLIYQICGLI